MSIPKIISKPKIITGLLFLSFLFCYLEWAGGNSGFLFQLEYEIFSNNANQNTLAHPFILIPLLGQLLLLAGIFIPNKKIILFGLSMTGILVLMLLLVGTLSLNIKIALSTLPFVILSILFIFNYKKK